jgi:hypothetical protein
MGLFIEKLHWGWKAFHYQKIRKPIQTVKNGLKRGFYGPDEHVFELYSSLSQWVLPRLREYKRTTHGMPYNLPGVDDPYNEHPETAFPVWLRMLDDMIYFHEQVVADSFPEDRDNNRYRRGKYYFFKYYEGLWN